jgi:hypothetical protein
MASEQLNREQKLSLYRDGYVVVKGAVAPELVERARARITAAENAASVARAADLTDLVNASSLTPILNEVMGRFDPPTDCLVRILEKHGPRERFNILGYYDEDMPYYGATLHIDGNIWIKPPQEIQQGTPEEIYDRFIAAGPKGDIGRSAEVLGSNLTPLFMDPEMTLSLGSFTAFLIVCLNDQARPGCGQTVMLPRAHHAMERFFRWQAAQDGHLGPEGADWPRLNFDSPNRSGMNYVPQTILDEFTDETSECTSDGCRWPRPEQVLMEPGDACIAVYNIPHSQSRNENGAESRKNIIFRIRNKSRQPDKICTGSSDHPDRGELGEWLNYESGNDPWKRSKHALCNMWEEWEGMQQIIADEQVVRY